jgi:hypothetical protein
VTYFGPWGFSGGSFDTVLTPTPIPAALPLFATGIGAIGLLGWRRKRKAQLVAAVVLTGQNIDRAWMKSVLAGITPDVLAVTDVIT